MIEGEKARQIKDGIIALESSLDDAQTDRMMASVGQVRMMLGLYKLLNEKVDALIAAIAED